MSSLDNFLNFNLIDAHYFILFCVFLSGVIRRGVRIGVCMNFGDSCFVHANLQIDSCGDGANFLIDSCGGGGTVRW